MNYEEDVTAFKHELENTLETVEEDEGQMLSFEADKLIKERDAAMQLKGKRDLLRELLQLADAFVLGPRSHYETAWDMLNEKYNGDSSELAVEAQTKRRAAVTRDLSYSRIVMTAMEIQRKVEVGLGWETMGKLFHERLTPLLKELKVEPKEKHEHVGELTIDRAQGAEYCEECDPALKNDD